jgi:hypothetical protein
MQLLDQDWKNQNNPDKQKSKKCPYICKLQKSVLVANILGVLIAVECYREFPSFPTLRSEHLFITSFISFCCFNGLLHSASVIEMLLIFFLYKFHCYVIDKIKKSSHITFMVVQTYRSSCK